MLCFNSFVVYSKIRPHGEEEEIASLNETRFIFLIYFLRKSLQHQSILNDMEEQKSLAESRLLEIEKLQEKYQECLKEAQQMKMDVSRKL